MKRRVKSFLLAILMVFTILPTNFTTAEAENSDIRIWINSDDGERLESDKINISLLYENHIIDDVRIGCKYNSDENKNEVDISAIDA